MHKPFVEKIPNLLQGISKQAPSVRFPGQVADAENCDFDLKDGARKRAGTQTLGVIEGALSYGEYKLHRIERDDEEEYLIVYGTEAFLKIYDYNKGVQAALFIPPEAETYIGTPDANGFAPNKDSYKFITVADTTFVVNKNVIPRTTENGAQLDPATMPHLLQRKSFDENGNALFEIKQGTWKSRSYNRQIINTANAGPTIVDGEENLRPGFKLKYANQTSVLLPQNATAQEVENALQGNGFDANDFLVEQKITVTAGGESRTEYTGEYEDIDLEIADDPYRGKGTIGGRAVAGLGTFKFGKVIVTGGPLGEKPMSIAISSDIDVDEMIEVVDDATGMGISLARGDNETDPPPAFAFDETQDGLEGMTIRDISYVRNRLVIAADEFICFSQIDDVFNFYLENPPTLVDSDAFDVQLASTEVTIIDHIVAFRGAMVVFTKSGQQFEMGGIETLSPGTATLTQTTKYQTADVRPEKVGDRVYFASSGNSESKLLEYYYSDSDAGNVALDISKHVEGLLPTKITGLTSEPNEETVFVLSEQELSATSDGPEVVGTICESGDMDYDHDSGGSNDSCNWNDCTTWNASSATTNRIPQPYDTAVITEGAIIYKSTDEYSEPYCNASDPARSSNKNTSKLACCKDLPRTYATATITFTGNVTNDETIVIISTDGTSKTYTAKASTNAASLQFKSSDKFEAAAALKTCIEHANGHGKRMHVSRKGAVLTLTQLKEGTDGNKTITSGLTNVTKTNFTGGSSTTAAPCPTASTALSASPSSCNCWPDDSDQCTNRSSAQPFFISPFRAVLKALRRKQVRLSSLFPRSLFRSAAQSEENCQDGFGGCCINCQHSDGVSGNYSYCIDICQEDCNATNPALTKALRDPVSSYANLDGWTCAPQCKYGDGKSCNDSAAYAAAGGLCSGSGVNYCGCFAAIHDTDDVNCDTFSLVGACLLPGGQCIDTSNNSQGFLITAEQCQIFGGCFLGHGTTCESNIPADANCGEPLCDVVTPGYCVYTDNDGNATCSPADCASMCSTFGAGDGLFSPGGVCPSTDPTGACCKGDGTCEDGLTESACLETNNGSAWTKGASCIDSSCVVEPECTACDPGNSVLGDGLGDPTNAGIAGKVHVYKAYTEGSERKQSAWGTWTFGKDRIQDATVIDEDLIIVRKQTSAEISTVGSYLVIDVLDLSNSSDVVTAVAADGNTEFSSSVALHLDHMIPLDQGTLQDSKTQWALNDFAGANVGYTDYEVDTIVVSDDGTSNANKSYAVTSVNNGTAIKTVEDVNLSTSKVFAGRKVRSMLELTPPYYRLGDGKPVLDGKTKQKKLIVEHKNTGSYDVEISSDQSTNHPVTRTNAYTVTDGSVDSLGENSAWVQGDASKTTVKLISDTAYPTTWVSIEHHGNIDSTTVSSPNSAR